ncbi:protein phosphatase CheZ [Paremcibacter congregatus]|uniref:protein phosphatase CheZ n=1 Tax=Paremcibacter congregatus TaxID=2043170 RepID=UPI0030EF6005|tara:strand:- start:1672 stop:2319 length:648 start_codon:yes stop_codon:yes gene_type:complete
MRLNSVSLEERIDSVRDKLGDKIAVSDVSMVVGEVMGSLEGDFDLQEVHFQDELRELLAYIEQAKADLTQIQPKHLSETKIPEASNQLDQVVIATEEAATKIMDSAEEISELSSTVEGELAERLETISTNIFEASSFQDITGQRVTKVVNTLKYLEDKLSTLAHAIGDTDSHIRMEESAATEVSPDSEDNLLHGPQCQVTGNDQDDIDALLASFD